MVNVSQMRRCGLIISHRVGILVWLLVCFLCFSSVALADVGGYAQTGIDRFTHGYELTGDPSYDIVTIALAQKGRTGSTLGYYDGDWCAAFVVDCAKYAGVDDLIPFNSGHTHGVGGAGGYAYLYETMLNKGASIVNTGSAKRGDIVFFGGSSGGDYSHVGIMVDNVNTIEGNLNGNAGSSHPWLDAVVAQSVRTRYNRVTVLRPNYPDPLGTLDINGYLDGTSSGNLGSYGTFTIRVGSNIQSGINDYYARHKNGTVYFIDENEIKANPGYEYLGVRSGSLSGAVSVGSTTEVYLSFAKQGSLFVQGNLDGIKDNSTEGYGTFDVYINGELVESNCTGYNKQWPTGTTYEIKNIQVASGKNYSSTASIGLSGTITSNTQSNAILALTSDGTVTTEWQTGKALPGNLNPEELDIEYDNHYETVATSSPGSGWTQANLVSTEYVNKGGTYESHYDLATSNTRALVSYYYYHWCATSGNNANYEPTSKYVHYDSISNVSSVYVDNTDTDAIDGSYKIYNLKWSNGNWAYCKSGTTCDGSNGSHGERSYHWYRMNTYQDKTEVLKYKWIKNSGWTNAYDASATSCNVRWRYKDGIPPVPPEEYHLTINGWLDGEQADDTSGYGSFDLYVDGALITENCHGIEMTFDHNPVYNIENIQVTVGKKYDGIHLGKISGSIHSGNATVTLSFSTVMDIGEYWTEVESLPQDLDLTGCEVEYKNHYVTTGRTSPGDEWSLFAEGAVQYENNGAQYMDDNDAKATSAECVLVGYYYFHYCNGGELANYYWKDYLPIKHTISMTDVAAHFSVQEKGTDGDGSGRKYYYLTHLDGEWAGGIAKCGSSGSKVYYRGGIYQNKKAYRINTYVRDSDWTTERDPQAASATVRIRLKQYKVILDGNGGLPCVETYKYYNIPIYLNEYIPEREEYDFNSWNTAANGSGEQYQADYVYKTNETITLYAQWTPISVVTLPRSTEMVDEEAFAHSGVIIVRIPAGCTSIQAKAFAGCIHLRKIYIPKSVTYIDTSAFDGIDSLIIVGDKDSIAELYASKRDWITFEVEE